MSQRHRLRVGRQHQTGLVSHRLRGLGQIGNRVPVENVFENEHQLIQMHRLENDAASRPVRLEENTVRVACLNDERDAIYDKLSGQGRSTGAALRREWRQAQ